MKDMTFTSLFAGIGGLDYGFIQGGWKPVFVNEFQTNTARSYENIHGHKVDTRCISLIDATEIADSTVIIGGPPCQSFSLVGKRSPNDPRGRLVFRFLDIIRIKQPRAFVMENVPGLMSSKLNGRRLVDILEEEFSALGYKVTRNLVLATDYGVPQRRKRLVLIGSKEKYPKFPNRNEFFKHLGVEPSKYSVSASSAIGDLGPAVKKGELATYAKSPDTPFAKLMRSGRKRKTTLHELPRMSERDSLYAKIIPPGGNYRDIPDDLSTPLNYEIQAARRQNYYLWKITPG